MSYAWHFVAVNDDGNPVLRDGTLAARVGGVEKYDGAAVMCESGLHASDRVLDALHYAPGSCVRLVEPIGEVEYGDDKMVGVERRIVAEIDATDVLRHFARLCALDVIHLWDAPAVVRQYLETGDEEIRTAARAAATEAAWAATEAARAARAAARTAATEAAWAAWAAARAKQNELLEGMLLSEMDIQETE